ncbi:MAG: MlaD family protein [Aliarcobacter sp.]
MDTKINFFRIGLFVSTLFFLLVVAIFWLGKYGIEDKKYDEYAVFFNESVSGLNVGSAIKYMGFQVGNVAEIKINPNNSEEIQINIQIQKGTPIKEDNFAVLGNIGITGLKYIELKGGANSSKLLTKNEKGIKVIKSKPSALTTFVDSTEDISRELMIVLAQIKKVLDDKNVDNLAKIISKSETSLTNIEEFSAYLVKNQKKIDEVLKNISDVSKKGSLSFDAVKNSANSFNTLTTSLQKELDNGSFNLKEISNESLENLNNVLKSLEITLNQTQSLIDNLNESPSDLILKRKDIKYGPGESDD